MSGRRASQRDAIRGAMLGAAARLFATHGLARTTIAEIAQAAGVGVATVYKHFKSKEGIAAALLRGDLEQLLAQGQRIVAAPPPDPAEAVVALLSGYRELGGHDWAQRELLRHTIFPGLGNEGALTELVRESEARVQAQIRALLAVFQQDARLAARLDLDDATSVIFAVFNQHFGRFLTEPDLKFPTLFRRLARQVRLLFDDWRAPSARLRRRRR